MGLKNRLIGECIKDTPGSDNYKFELGDFVNRLLMFDTYILKSVFFKEFGDIVNIFGVKGIIEILHSNALKINIPRVWIGETGHTGIYRMPHGKKILANCEYSFLRLKVHDCEKETEIDLRNIDDITNITNRDKDILKEEIFRSLENPPEEFGIPSLRDLENDLKNNSPIIKEAIIEYLRHKHKKNLLNSQFHCLVRQISDTDFYVDSNLDQILKKDKQWSHNVFLRSLLALAYRNKKIEEMKAFNALTGFMKDEIPLFSKTLDFLTDIISPDCKTSRMNKLIEITNFPLLISTKYYLKKIDAHKLLKLREMNECKEFRYWIDSVDDKSEEEFLKIFKKTRHKVGNFLKKPYSKAIRFLITSGIGAIPSSRILVSPAIGVLDTFLLEKILPSSGIVSFIDELYPSIFIESKN